MFKAKLVEPNKFSFFKRKQIIAILGMALLTGLTTNVLLNHILFMRCV